VEFDRRRDAGSLNPMVERHSLAKAITEARRMP
jgi:hypothetical protein